MSEPVSTPGPTSPAALVGQARALWRRLPLRARALALGSSVAILGLVAYLVLQSSGGSWRLVTDGLNAEEAGELIAVLDQRGIPHRMRAGAVVEVPSDRIHEARAAAVVAQVPRSTKGWEITEKSSLGQTSAQERVRFQRALQGELARSIAALGPIERARVNVAFGVPSVIDRNAKPPTASVQVHLRAGATLQPEQVAGIKQLVAAAVNGLEPERVVVIDQNANPLSSELGKPGDDAAELEAELARDVRAVIEPVVGVGNIIVVVRVQLDRRKINKTEELFGKEPILLSQDLTTTAAGGAGTGPGTAPASGLAGTASNLPGTTGGAAATAGAPTGTIIRSLINNQLDRTVTQTEEPESRVQKVSLAVLLAEPLDEDGELAARAPEELAKIRGLAIGAAAIDDQRGDTVTIESMPFAPIEAAAMAPAPRGGLPVPLPVAAGAGALLLIAGVILIRRRKRQPDEHAAARIALPAPVAELERALAAPSALAGGSVPTLPPGRSLEERVLGAVKGDVPRAARVLAAWLAEPDPVAANPNPKAARS